MRGIGERAWFYLRSARFSRAPFVRVFVVILCENWRTSYARKRTGQENNHVAINDNSRLSYAADFAGKAAETTASFLREAVT